MTRDDIIQAIYHILKNKIELPTIDSFHEEARLNEESCKIDAAITLDCLISGSGGFCPPIFTSGGVHPRRDRCYISVSQLGNID